MKKVFLLSIYLLCFISSNFCQNRRIKFDHINLDDGLSQSSITSITQDHKEFMWFGTLDGLNKYDGYSIKVYRNNLKNPYSIPDNSITSLYVDRNGELWVGTTSKGFCRYDKIQDRFITFDNSPANPNKIASNNIKTFFEDSRGSLWIGTKEGLSVMNTDENNSILFKNLIPSQVLKDEKISDNIVKITEGPEGTLYIATTKQILRYDLHNSKLFTYEIAEILPHSEIHTIHLDKELTLWIGTSQGLVVNHISDSKIEVFKHSGAANSLSSNKVTTILEDHNSEIWIGTEKGGLNKFDRIKKTFSSFYHDPSDEQSLSVNHVVTLFQDKAHIVWVGTNLGGINKWNRAAEDLEVFRHNPYDPHSLSSNQVRCIYQDRSGNIWIGTVDGGLNKWNKDQNKFIHYLNSSDNPNSISSNHVRTILEDSDGDFWVGTSGGGLNKFDKRTEKFTSYRHSKYDTHTISDDDIWKIFQDSRDNLWIATMGGGLVLLDKKTMQFKAFKHNEKDPNSISDNNVTSIFEDHSNKLWIGTYGGGLNLFDLDKQIFTHFRFDKNNPYSLGNDRIYSIFEDKEKVLWIGTKGSLNEFERKSKKFIRYTENEGLPNDVIMGILEDKEENLWISTNKGLARFNKKTHKIRNYDVRSGLQSNEFLVGSYCKSYTGEMFFGGIRGFNAFFPDKIKDNPHAPQIVITGFKIFNNEAKLDSNISEKKIIYLTHKDYSFSFDFVALDYIFPEKNQYAYIMEGFENKWNYVKNRRFASYTNLPPGVFRFKVKGSNNDEVWNELGTVITIIVKPALWQTIWFKIAIILLIGLIVYSFFKIRVNRIKAQKAELERLVKLRTAEIVKKNTQLEESRDKIAQQNKEITDSIVYAKRIQTATLPKSEQIKKAIGDIFILLKPKDIVSGDFYWIGQQNAYTIIAAADCTGHGVPGAFMSMLGISLLNKIINEEKFVSPDDILNHLRANVISSLQQKGFFNEAKDGMDITIITINNETRELAFAGANNPMYFIRNNTLEIIKGDSMPIAIYDKMDSFQNHVIKIQENDRFYLFSDGYMDQFGGDKNKKFLSKRFKDLILGIHEKDMEEQKALLDLTIETWKGVNDQIDDILVIGVLIKL